MSRTVRRTLNGSGLTIRSDSLITRSRVSAPRRVDVQWPVAEAGRILSRQRSCRRVRRQVVTIVVSVEVDVSCAAIIRKIVAD